MSTGPATTAPFQYAVLRAVPRVERGEFVNVGVILYCQQHEFLAAALALDEHRLTALAPDLDLTALRQAAESVERACREPVGHARENTGLATLFGMLVAPRSTVLQPSPVHAGIATDPRASLDQLLTRLVRA